ncbi:MULTISPECIES: arylsulfatase [unclassified Novosphingobium]|uniref:arylsulfatase n=1 Tax=unclassified Novosphingobium TaxID=2644732 RepID=UPI00146EC629|nr:MULTISPECIES: arylsulfatase [unclassified Novosphingobium]NMN04545.1 arylsulfatase [Novosphingobium sp. SG919]NMN85462.1 arylsulfatase [Novosphingobium sp. SG916]
MTTIRHPLNPAQPALRRALAQAALLLAGTALSASAMAQRVPAGEDFTGKIGATRATSQSAFPHQAQAPKAAPNVLLVLIDDAGFAASSTFGGGAPTPNLDRLASEGVRYNRFHTTGICSPTRAALLTGRNHHQVGFGNLADIAAGFPAYNSIWKQETASLPRILQLNGYSTAAFGKWHNTPRWEVSAAGPFNHWPTGLGFDHFYGFMAGDDNQWEPSLYNDTTPVPLPGTPETGYHFTTDLVNKALGWVDNHNAVVPGKPWFLYLAPGAVHMPHHVPQEWIARNKGRFDAGWDAYREQAFARQKKLGIIPADAKLTPRPAGLPAWNSLSADEKKLYAHQMEVYAAFLEQTDAEVGRLVDQLRQRPGGDNLMVVYIVGDNGGSAEGDLEGTITNEAAKGAGAPNDVATELAHIDQLGGPELANHYAAGWAWATTTPFQWMKQVASHFGGTRNPLIIDWPGHTAQSGVVRSQFGHVNDIAPTVLDAAGITLPAQVDGVPQLPFEGKSLVPTFTNPAAPEAHTEQYFEIFGNRAIYKDGWVAAAKRPYNPWDLLKDVGKIYADTTDQDRWELYNVAKDFSESDDLAAKNPAKLAELKAEFVKEGTRNGVFPLIPLPLGAPTLIDPRQKAFTWRAGTGGLPPSAQPQLVARAHRFEVAISSNAAAGTGVLIAQGGRLGGYVLYERDGRLAFENNAYNQTHEVIVAPSPLPAGPVKVGFAFEPAPVAGGAGGLGALLPKVGGGTIRLLVNGQVVAQGNVAYYPTHAAAFSETLDFGVDRNSQVSKEPAARQPYSGTLDQVTLTFP